MPGAGNTEKKGLDKEKRVMIFRLLLGHTTKLSFVPALSKKTSLLDRILALSLLERFAL